MASHSAARQLDGRASSSGETLATVAAGTALIAWYRAPAEAALARTRLSRGGDYVPPDANVVARGLFVDAVVRLVPEALDELKVLAPQLPGRNLGVVTGDSDIFNQERPLRDWCLKFGFTAVPWVKGSSRDGTPHTAPLGADWLLELARRTTDYLRTQGDPPQTPAEVIKMCVTATYAPVEGPPPPCWDSDRVPEREFTARQKTYRDQVKQAARKAGRIVAPSVNHPRTAQRDFEWLALFQVGRLEVADLRARCRSRRPSADTIRMAIAAAAKHAAVHLRAAQRGRPRDV
jgi:hypothetical protein